MVFEDAPYNVKIDGHVRGLGKTKHREFAMAAGEMTQAEFQAFLATNLRALLPHLVDGAVVEMCMDWRHALELQLAMAEAGLEQINLAVWIKSNGGMGSLLRSQHELVFIGKHGKASPINNVQLGRFERYRTNVWRYPGVNTFGRGRMEQLSAHPTPKPVPLVADAIRDVTHRGQIVLDGFMGSGTTLLAAERTERIAYGIDLHASYVDVAILRCQAMTGQEARLEISGQTFAEVKAERQQDLPIDDVLPFSHPLISRVLGCQDALAGGVAQPAWQHRRASARLSRYAAAHGCSRRASCAAPTAHGSKMRTASR
ncbi:MAG: site-specific DNA-methyltransferase [Croceibacterium sp.]